MSLKKFLSNEVPQIQVGDQLDYVKSLFFASELTYLPCLDAEGKYLGLVSQNDIVDYSGESAEITAELCNGFKFYITLHAHPFEALKIVHLNQLDVLPVLYDDGEYAGAVLKSDLVDNLINNVGVDAPGGIILLEIVPRDYSLSQIARICENEQVLILGLISKSNLETEKLDVTIKTNSTYLSAVVQALERYGYNVVATYGDQSLQSDAEDRYKLLMNYIYM
jgi:acetoin utilization protein AcuB